MKSPDVVSFMPEASSTEIATDAKDVVDIVSSYGSTSIAQKASASSDMVGSNEEHAKLSRDVVTRLAAGALAHLSNRQVPIVFE